MREQTGFTDREDLMVAWDSLLNRRDPVDIGGISQKLESRTSALNANRNRYRNRLRSADITVSVAPRGQTKEKKEAAQRVENFFQRVFFDIARKRTSATFDPDGAAEDFAVWAGVGPRNLEWADDVKELLVGENPKTNEELKVALERVLEKGFVGNPFQLHAPHPMQVFYDPNFRKVCEVGEKTVEVLLGAFKNEDFRKYAFRIGEDEPTSDTMPEFEGLWDDVLLFYHLETSEYIYDVVRDAGENNPRGEFEMQVRPNPAGRPRYTFQAGHLTSDNEPGLMFQPLIKDLYSVAQHINYAHTLLMTMMLSAGRPMYQEVSDHAGRADTFVELAIRPGESRRVISFDTSEQTMPESKPGHHWEPLAIQTPDPLIKAIEILQQQFRDLGFPAILSPEAGIDVTSGFDRAQQAEAAVDFLEPPLKNKAAAWHELFMLSAEMLIEIDLPVTFPTIPRAQGGSRKGGQIEVTVNPNDFKDIDLEVGFSSVPATAKFAADEADRRDMQLGLLSPTTFFERHFDDHVAERERIAFDRVAKVAEDLAIMQAQNFIRQIAPQEAASIAADLGIPPLVPSDGGPADPGEARNARPAGGSVPGLGSPLTPPQQSENGAPPAAGTGSTPVVNT